MKASSLILTGSLVANAALLVLLIAGMSADKPTPVLTSSPSNLAGATAARDSAPAADAKTWANLNPDELTGLFERLRAAGFSRAVARALLAEQVRGQFASRRAALYRAAAERPFWEPATPNPATAAALAQLGREQNQAIKNFLGPEASIDEFEAAILRRQFPHFPEAKITAIQRFRQDVHERAQELGVTVGAAPPELVALMKEREADIARLLTPKEREDYDLRMSNTATNLRQELAGFDPTEAEFLALYQLQRAYADASNRSAGGILRPSNAFSDAEKQHIEQLKTILGEQRYADYLRSIDGNFQRTARLTARLGLPSEAANQVYAVQKDIQQQLATLEANRTLTPEERATRFAALAAEAQSKVTFVLGAHGYEAYKHYGGTWIGTLQPRPVAVPRPPGF